MIPCTQSIPTPRGNQGEKNRDNPPEIQQQQDQNNAEGIKKRLEKTGDHQAGSQLMSHRETGGGRRDLFQFRDKPVQKVDIPDRAGGKDICGIVALGTLEPIQ